MKITVLKWVPWNIFLAYRLDLSNLTLGLIRVCTCVCIISELFYPSYDIGCMHACIQVARKQPDAALGLGCEFCGFLIKGRGSIFFDLFPFRSSSCAVGWNQYPALYLYTYS